MIEKLQEVENRFEEVNELVCNPDIVCDQEKYTKLMRELKHLTIWAKSASIPPSSSIARDSSSLALAFLYSLNFSTTGVKC